MLKLKPGGGGGRSEQKNMLIQTTSLMNTEDNTHTQTHRHTIFMLKLKPGGGGAGQNKKNMLIQTTSLMNTEPNTNIQTQRLPMTIKYHFNINIHVHTCTIMKKHTIIILYLFNQGSCTYDTNIMSPRIMHIQCPLVVIHLWYHPAHMS